jgi:hypothetical protein
VLGVGNNGGGTFDHIHLEYSPGCGTEDKIKVNGSYKTAQQLYDDYHGDAVNPPHRHP